MASFDFSEHPHRRLNPLTGEHVLVSPHRTKRPWLGQIESVQGTSLPEYDAECYLCPGNARLGGEKNSQYENTLTFPNDFPALLPSSPSDKPVAPHHLLQSDAVTGACDVVIFHPRHDLTLARLSLPDIVHVIREWTRIYKVRSEQHGIEYVQIFENRGAMMGCSNPHPHGQVWSLSAIPTIPAIEIENLRKYAESGHPLSDAPNASGDRANLLLEYVHYELSVALDISRVVYKNSDWVALVPWWAVWPFEMLVLPYRRQIKNLLELTEEEIQSFADVLSSVTIRYDNLFKTPFAYSMGVHQQPIVKSTFVDCHLHLHFTPPLLRSATIRKFLVGFELMAEAQRDLTPEQAAKRLREISSIHYLNSA